MNYMINETAVIFDVIDGEIVIIHLESGNYYHLEESGALIWKLLAREASADQISEYVATYYGLEAKDVPGFIEPFFQKLTQEGLVLERTQRNENSAIEMPSEKRDSAFVPPEIDVFTDMQDFLLVDPIHEVDEHGLPKYTSPVIDDV